MKEAQDKRFTHLDKEGNPNMVDVSHKIVTRRTAKARALVQLTDEILDHLQKEDIHTKRPRFSNRYSGGYYGRKENR